MSHIETGKTSLVFKSLLPLLKQGDAAALSAHPCIALLRQALTIVAQQEQGEIEPFYYDFRYSKQAANTGLALRIPESRNRTPGHALPRGIGLVINPKTGALEFKGDAWEVDKTFYQRVQHRITQNYTVLANVAALRQLRYQVSTQQMEDGCIRISGVTHAA